MPIRRVQQPDEPIHLHRLTVDRRMHPRLHAALREIGMGAPCMNFIRDTLEAALAGITPVVTPSPDPPDSSQHAPESTPRPESEAAKDLEAIQRAERKARAAAFMQRSGL